MPTKWFRLHIYIYTGYIYMYIYIQENIDAYFTDSKYLPPQRQTYHYHQNQKQFLKKLRRC